MNYISSLSSSSLYSSCAFLFSSVTYYSVLCSWFISFQSLLFSFAVLSKMLYSWFSDFQNFLLPNIFPFDLLFPLFHSLSWIKISIFIPPSCQAPSRNETYLARKYFFVVMATIWDGKISHQVEQMLQNLYQVILQIFFWLLQLLLLKKWINLLPLEMVECLQSPHSSSPIWIIQDYWHHQEVVKE